MRKHLLRKSKAYCVRFAFTLVEIVVVITVLGLSLPVFFNLIFNLGKQQANLGALQRVKAEGDFVQQLIISTVQDRAETIDATCTGIAPVFTDQKICFVDENGDVFGYGTEDGGASIASHSATAADAHTLIGNAATAQIPVHITDPVFTKLNEKTVQLTYTVEHTPTASYLSTIRLTYNFYIVLQRHIL